MRLDLGVAATVVVLAAMVLGVALLLPSDQAPAVRALGAVLLVAAGVATIKLLSWARGWRWHYDRPTRGLSDGETFLIARPSCWRAAASTRWWGCGSSWRSWRFPPPRS